MDVLKNLGIEPVNSGACFDAGEWSTAGKAGELASVNPATEDIIAKVNLATEGDYTKVVTQATQAFQIWRQVPAPKRGELIRAIGDQLRAKKDFLGTLVALETGKPKQEGDGEVQEAIDMADFAVGQARMLYGKTMHSERSQHRMYEQWHPLGPVGVITAFNFPVAVWSWNAFIAAIAGNTVVWKPSPKVPLCAIALQKICNAAMQQLGYSGVFSLLITDQNPLAEKMVSDRHLPLISFTGSTAVGRKVNEAVARRLGRCLLELSGNNAVIVDETANIPLAVRAILFGAVGTAGQRCTTTRRVIIHESKYKAVIKQLVQAYKKVKAGNPLGKDVLMGPLIDEVAVQCFKLAVEEAQRDGGKVLYGGKVREGTGYFVEPTIIAADNRWDIVQRETFAPILYVMSYKTLEQAVSLHNSVGQGLSSALFTESVHNAEYFLSAVGSDCGIANINIGTAGAEIGGAFGGEKDTGGGREAGSDAWKGYMRRQTNTINWGEELPLAQGIKFELDSPA